jgi:hypothetical protein
MSGLKTVVVASDCIGCHYQLAEPAIVARPLHHLASFPHFVQMSRLIRRASPAANTGCSGLQRTIKRTVAEANRSDGFLCC